MVISSFSGFGRQELWRRSPCLGSQSYRPARVPPRRGGTSRLVAKASYEPDRDETGRFDRERLAKESRYPLKLPLLFFSSVIGGKGLTDALATAMKVSAGIRGATLDPVFLSIDGVCMALGLGLGYWTWTTMSDDTRGDKPGGAASAGDSTAADLPSLMLQVMMPPEPAAQQKGPDAGAVLQVRDLPGTWVLIAGPESVVQPSLSSMPEDGDLKVLPWVLERTGRGGGQAASAAKEGQERQLLSLPKDGSAQEGWDSFVMAQVAAAKVQGIDTARQAIVLLVGSGGTIKQKRVAQAPEGVVWSELL